MSIYLTTIKGKIVKSIIGANSLSLNKNLANLGLFSFPGGFLNSYINYLQKSMSLKLRKGINRRLNHQYLLGNTAYQMLHVDDRIKNPDQIITVDLEKFCDLVFEVYAQISKPLLDIILFSRKLSQTIGYKSPILMTLWYLFAGVIIKKVTPNFGKLMSNILQEEGNFRAGHQRILNHNEEIAFLRGTETEHIYLNNKLKKLLTILRKDANLRFYMGIIDSILIKYGAFTMGVGLLAVPVFGSDSHKYISQKKGNPTKIIKDYESNSGLLVNFAKAIGTISISYKKIQELAGACQRVSLFLDVCDDLQEKQMYKRLLLDNFDLLKSEKGDMNQLNHGKVWTLEDAIKMDGVPIIQPNGERLIDEITFRINENQNTIISGSNGTGKTALVRVLSGLWPLAKGQISIVSPSKILFLPQRAYMPRGTLRDLIIYPDKKSKMNDSDIVNIIEKVFLKYLYERVGGVDAILDWANVLSGGERQRLSVARIYYHRPKFAVLDESTSEVNPETENQLYIEAKKCGVTLITVSQRDTLKQHHEYIFRILDNKEWSFEKFQFGY
jgi:ATP-binding cassette subfamily D (ALD) protein 3